MHLLVALQDEWNFLWLRKVRVLVQNLSETGFWISCIREVSVVSRVFADRLQIDFRTGILNDRAMLIQGS